MNDILIKWLPRPVSITSHCDITHIINNKDDQWLKERYLPWRFFYVDYDTLKSSDNDNIDTKLQDEWIKVYDFYTLKRGDIERRIDYYKILMEKQDNPVQSRNTLKLMLIEIHHLYHFVKLNYSAFLRLLMHHGTHTDGLEQTINKRQLWDHFLPLLHLCFKINQQVSHDKARYYFPDLSHVSSTNKKRITENHGPLSGEEVWSNTLSRRTHTYWVHPDNLMELVLFLCTKSTMRNGSTIYYGASSEAGKPNVGDDMKEATRLTTMYLDSAHLATYKQLCRQQQHEPIYATRVRWSENNAAAMAERKFYKKGNEEWVQERLWLKPKHVEAWMNADFSIKSQFSKDSCEFKSNGSVVGTDEQVEKVKEACLAFENKVHSEEKVLPVMKVEQSRLHFVLNDSDITVSIDYDIVLNCLISQETAEFPYCVFQISFDSHSKSADESEWLQLLAQHDALRPVADFSLYVHGVGTLSKQKILPSWIPQATEADDLRCYSSRGQLIEDEPDLYIKRSSLTNRKSIDSIATTAVTDTSSGGDFSSGTQHTVITSHASLYEKTKETPKRHGSYCSFDHPTSSSSDPTNCKSCMPRLILPEPSSSPFDRLHSPIFRRPRPSDQEVTTFGTLLLKTFLPRRFRSYEKEPLMSPTYRQYRTFSAMNLAELGKATGDGKQLSQTWSQAAVLASVFVVLSSSIICFVYILISADI